MKPNPLVMFIEALAGYSPETLEEIASALALVEVEQSIRYRRLDSPETLEKYLLGLEKQVCRKRVSLENALIIGFIPVCEVYYAGLQVEQTRLEPKVEKYNLLTGIYYLAADTKDVYSHLSYAEIRPLLKRYDLIPVLHRNSITRPYWDEYKNDNETP